MSNYTQNVSYAPKDALATGDAAKRIKGTELDAEFAEITTAIASKEDVANKNTASGYAGLDAGALVLPANLPAATATAIGAVELATTAEVVTGTDTTRAVTAAGVEAWGAQNAGMVQDIADLASPGADRLLFWDQSAVGVALGSFTGMTMTGTVLSVDTQTNASALTSGTLPDARIAITGVTQHQASLTIAESQITDSTVLARVGGNETISGTWTFSNNVTLSSTLTKSGGGKFPYFSSATQSSGIITIGTAAVSGTPAAGDIYIQHAV